MAEERISVDAPRQGAGNAHRWETAAALAAFALAALNVRLLNTAYLPLLTPVLPVAGELTVGCSVLANALILAASVFRPKLLNPQVLGIVAAALSLAGSALSIVGSFAAIPPLAVAGALIRGFGTAWVPVVAWTVCCNLSLRVLLVGIPAATGAAYLCAWALESAPESVALAAFCLAPLACLALTYRPSFSLLQSVSSADARTDAALSHPSSFLPLTNRLFVCMLLSTVVAGLNARNLEGAAVATLVPSVALYALIVAWGAVRPAMRRFDQLFSIAILIVMGGFLTMPLSGSPAVPAILFSLGNSCLNVLFALVLIAAAKRNPLSAVTMFAWGNTLTSFGSIVGANLGTLLKPMQFGGTIDGMSIDLSYLLLAGIALLFLGYVLFGLRDFSFSATIEGIEAVEPLRVPTAEDPQRLATRCRELAAGHGLTPRETEVLGLLARGRNNQFIQDELTLTRNTVKTYIKRVYAKIDVHSQQELIDLVDQG